MKKRKSCILWKFIFFIIILGVLIHNVSAADVAYLYNKKFRIDNGIVKFFNEMNLSVDLINEKNFSKTDFSKYRLIFVGDERFSKPKDIPIDRYPTVIMNYNHGPVFGLTDRDGISKLGRTEPMSVRKNNTIIQVYTKAMYDFKRVAIPYYYLANGDKVPTMIKVAGTYSGNSYDLGDVISYAKAGTHLINGKTTKKNLCFFGIVESEYWTDEAKKLFKDCINYVSVVCYENKDCDDKNPYTFDKCINPGTIKSFCTYENITCIKDSDCDDNNVSTEDKCVNPGTVDSYCKHYEIKCFKNSDCGIDGFVDGLFCKNNSVYQNFVTFKCNNAGTSGSYCSNSSEARLNKSCGYEEFCENGECIKGVHDVGFIDFTNSLNGIFLEYSNETEILGIPNLSCRDIIKGKVKVLNKGNFVENVTLRGNIGNIIFNLNDIDNLLPGDYSYRSILSPYIKLNLSSGSYNLTITANISNDQNLSDNVAKRLLNVLCLECENDSDCPEGKICYQGSCIKPCLDEDSDSYDTCNPGEITDDGKPRDCNDSNHNVHPNAIERCNGIDDNCDGVIDENNGDCSENQMCINGQCVNIRCSKNSDCGSDGFVGDPFCQDKSVYQNFITFKCNNPGTSGSYCSNSSEARLKQICVIGCEDGQCIDCQDAQNILNSIYTSINYGNDPYNLNQEKNVSYCNILDILLSGAGSSPICDQGNPACNRNLYYGYNGPSFDNSKSGWSTNFYVDNDSVCDSVFQQAICIPNNNVSKYFSVYVKVSGNGSDKFSLDQNNTIALCDPGDKVISGGGYAPICEKNSDPACGKTQYLENNQPVFVGNQEGWVSYFDLGGNEIYDTVQTFAVCLKKTQLFDTKFKIYKVENSGNSLYDLDQNRTLVYCDPGDIAISGGGFAPLCDKSMDPACGKTQYLEINKKIINGNREGWASYFDLGGNEIYDTIKTSVICIGISDQCKSNIPI